jgi:hypothetical protein
VRISKAGCRQNVSSWIEGGFEENAGRKGSYLMEKVKEEE